MSKRISNIQVKVPEKIGDYTFDYCRSYYMFVLNTKNSSWELSTNMQNSVIGDFTFEGATMQISANNTIACIFGGIKVETSCDCIHIFKTRVLNIKISTF